MICHRLQETLSYTGVVLTYCAIFVATSINSGGCGAPAAPEGRAEERRDVPQDCAWYAISTCVVHSLLGTNDVRSHYLVILDSHYLVILDSS